MVLKPLAPFMLSKVNEDSKQLLFMWGLAPWLAY